MQTEHRMADLDLAVIGNCSYAALVDQQARIVWACLPHFDEDPVFCQLLHPTQAEAAEAGYWDIAVEDYSHSTQRYVADTAILTTTLHDRAGNELEIVDFAPRFRQYGRHFRPTALVRRLRPTVGTPRIRVRLRPLERYGAKVPATTHGSNHIRYVGATMTLRLTTDLPLSYIRREVAFELREPATLYLGPDESLTRSVGQLAQEFFERTRDYWREFARMLSIPFEWQEEVIRAAITLKLCSYEDTGAIIAAMTTSIPEARDSGRNWDYRYCWLRDSYFVVHALNRLGATETLERYLRYISNVAAGSPDGYLQPVYGIHLERQLQETMVPSLAGYRGMGPVRVGNSAFSQVQNDGYGSVILAVTQMFFDRRLAGPETDRAFDRLERVGEQAVARYNQPDASLWEYRGTEAVHTLSSVMCWAGCDRLAKIAARLGRPDRAAHWRAEADRLHTEICRRAWSDSLGRFTARWDGDGADASLFLLHELGFLRADDPRFESTVRELEKVLRVGDYVYRYTEDEFGSPSTAFIVCTFWYIDALAALGRRAEARALFERMLARRNHVGLLSEDIDPESGELWGNLPQTYSMVGLINSAMRLSTRWEDAF